MRLTMLSGLWKRFETCRGRFDMVELKFWKNKSWICLGFVEVIIAGMRIWSWILRLRNRVKPPKRVKHFIVVNVIVPWRSHFVRGGGNGGFRSFFKNYAPWSFFCACLHLKTSLLWCVFHVLLSSAGCDCCESVYCDYCLYFYEVVKTCLTSRLFECVSTVSASRWRNQD